MTMVETLFKKNPHYLPRRGYRLLQHYRINIIHYVFFHRFLLGTFGNTEELKEAIYAEYPEMLPGKTI